MNTAPRPDGPDRQTPLAARVTVLLGLHNGMPWLGEQIDSIRSQDCGGLHLIVSDDGSTDDGPDLLHTYARAHPDFPVTLLRGACMGFARNFQNLLLAAPTDVPFTALSDQDDVWQPAKLSRAIDRLGAYPADHPVLYCSRTTVCSEALEPLHKSALFTRPPSFRNALVQSLGGGNTMVLNAAALRLAQHAAARPDAIVAHDWWLYQVITGAGGTAIHDTEPHILYRQHPKNTFGANRGIAARASRLAGLFGGQLKTWNRVNLAALENLGDDLEPESRATLKHYAAACAGFGVARVWHLWRSGIYRQSRTGTLALYIAALLGRL